MTCIVGLVHDGKVFMGADAAINSADSWLQPQSMRPKIWKRCRCTDMLVGVGGKQRISQLVQKFEPPSPPILADVYEYLVNEYVPKLISYLDSARVIKNNEDDGMICMDATILIGLLGRLFKIDSSFAITEYLDYAAIGANAEVALGVLYATSLLGSPIDRIQMALDAVLHHCASVREPFTILEI